MTLVFALCLLCQLLKINEPLEEGQGKKKCKKNNHFLQKNILQSTSPGWISCASTAVRAFASSSRPPRDSPLLFSSLPAVVPPWRDNNCLCNTNGLKNQESKITFYRHFSTEKKRVTGLMVRKEKNHSRTFCSCLLSVRPFSRLVRPRGVPFICKANFFCSFIAFC